MSWHLMVKEELSFDSITYVIIFIELLYVIILIRTPPDFPSFNEKRFARIQLNSA